MPRYNYPFSNTERLSGVRCLHDFSVQTAIDATKGMIIEIGGPTHNGFFFLKNVDFPRRPIITNKYRHGGSVYKEQRDISQLYIETTLDIRRARMDPKSVGVCLAAHLNVLASEPSTKKQVKWERAFTELEMEDKRLAAAPDSLPRVGLRYILLHRALSFMEPGGILVLEGLREPELKYAIKIGLHLKATTGAVKQDDATTTYPAVVLKR